MQVNVISGVVSGINIRFVDTPGLEAAASAVRKNQKVLLGIKAAHKKYNPDIVLYVDRVDVVRHSLPCPLFSKNAYNTTNPITHLYGNLSVLVVICSLKWCLVSVLGVRV
jgi:hypothetical protein